MLRKSMMVLVACCIVSTVQAQSFCQPVSATTLVSPVVLGNGSPGSISTAQLQAALDAGGHILLNQGAAPSTIVVNNTLVASRETVLDGGGLVTLSGGNTRRIMRLINPNPAQNAPTFTVALQNISFSNGRAADIDARGGAIYKEHDFEFPHKVALKLVNCRFSDNVAPLDASSQDDGGGAFYGELMLRIDIGQCIFENNEGSNGGALYSLGTQAVNIVDSVFNNNRAIGTGGNPGNGGNGGGIGIDGAMRTFDACRTRLSNNTSNAFGAGFFSVMYDAASRTRFEDVGFIANRQLNAAGQHTGGAYIQDGPWAMERVSFIQNEANGFGGLFVAGNAPGTLRNGTFVGNIARTGLGAAMALTNTAAIAISNTTIANNVSTAAFAAGIAIGAPNQLRLTNTVFNNNTGGNVFVNWAMQNPAQFDGGGNMQWPQQRSGGGGMETRVTPGAQYADALLAAGAVDNGGAVPTIALTAASPARDSGVSTADVPPTDARGFARLGAVDRGAYEFNSEVPLFANGFE